MNFTLETYAFKVFAVMEALAPVGVVHNISEMFVNCSVSVLQPCEVFTGLSEGGSQCQAVGGGVALLSAGYIWQQTINGL